LQGTHAITGDTSLRLAQKKNAGKSLKAIPFHSPARARTHRKTSNSAPPSCLARTLAMGRRMGPAIAWSSRVGRREGSWDAEGLAPSFRRTTAFGKDTLPPSAAISHRRPAANSSADIRSSQHWRRRQRSAGETSVLFRARRRRKRPWRWSWWRVRLHAVILRPKYPPRARAYQKPTTRMDSHEWWLGSLRFGSHWRTVVTVRR
jgi:hypothetical protein